MIMLMLTMLLMNGYGSHCCHQQQELLHCYCRSSCWVASSQETFEGDVHGQDDDDYADAICHTWPLTVLMMMILGLRSISIKQQYLHVGHAGSCWAGSSKDMRMLVYDLNDDVDTCDDHFRTCTSTILTMISRAPRDKNPALAHSMMIMLIMLMMLYSRLHRMIMMMRTMVMISRL